MDDFKDDESMDESSLLMKSNTMPHEKKSAKNSFNYNKRSNSFNLLPMGLK